MPEPPQPADRSALRRVVDRGGDVPVVVWIGLAAFVGLGLPEATLGVTWPSIRADLDRPLSSVGILLGALTAGYLPSSAVSGRVAARLGAGRMLAIASGIYVVALCLYLTAPAFGFLVAGSFLGGLAAGAIDPGLNAHFALHHGTRAMNLLHAAFGLGATGGPFIATAVIGWGGSWRIPYAVYAVVQAALLLAFFATRDHWARPTPPRRRDTATAVDEPSASRPLVALSALQFFLYTGLEVSAGVLAFSLLTEGRGLSAAVGGLWATAFWAGITVGRLGLGVVGARLGPQQILRASVLGAVASTVIVWVDIAGTGAAGFPLLGVSLAGIFPSLVLLTPVRIGATRTADAIGLQLSLAAIGAAAVPATIGVLVEDDLERIGPALVVLAVTVAVLDAALSRHDQAATRRGAARPRGDR